MGVIDRTGSGRFSGLKSKGLKSNLSKPLYFGGLL